MPLQNVINVYNIVINVNLNKLVIAVLLVLVKKQHLLLVLKLMHVYKHVVMEIDSIYNVMMEIKLMVMVVMLIVKLKMDGLVLVEAVQQKVHAQILSQHQADSLSVVM
jgi:hypothetical protein